METRVVEGTKTLGKFRETNVLCFYGNSSFLQVFMFYFREEFRKLKTFNDLAFVSNYRNHCKT